MLNLVIGMSAIYMCSPWLLHRSATINQPSIADCNGATVTYNSWVSGLWSQFPGLHVKHSPKLGHLNKMKRLWKVRMCFLVQFCLPYRYLLGGERINKQTPGMVMSDTGFASEIFSVKGLQVKQMKKQVRENVWLPNLAIDKTWWRY